MRTPSHTAFNWLVFCRSSGILRPREHFSCVCGEKRVIAEFAVVPRNYGASLDGELLGATFRFEAKSRRRLAGDTADSGVPLYVGRFEHEAGASGDFTIRPKPDGELMTLGVYGAPHLFKVVKTDPARVACPVEVHGLPGMEMRFEDPNDPWHKPSFSKRELSAAGEPRHYAGYCVAHRVRDQTLPPMLAVLVAMTLAYQRLLKPSYLDPS